MPRRLSVIQRCAALMLLALVSNYLQADSNKSNQAYLYRYVNDQGVKVMNHTVPPEFVQNGYEVLSRTGQLIKVVEPAPSEGEISQRVKDRQLKQKYDALKRRYSSVEDIDNAKARRLKSLDTSISILRSNIDGINIRLEDLMKEAADMERQGRDVANRVLQQMEDAKMELSIAESSLDKRMQEYDEVAMKFDEDRSAFVEGSELFTDADEDASYN